MDGLMDLWLNVFFVARVGGDGFLKKIRVESIIFGYEILNHRKSTIITTESLLVPYNFVTLLGGGGFKCIKHNLPRAMLKAVIPHLKYTAQGVNHKL